MSEQPSDPADRPDASGQVDTDDDTGQKLPPRPEPYAEPQAPPPGGPHAIEGVGGDGAYTTEPHDMNPNENPATDEALPDEAKEPDDTDTAATRGEESPQPTEESPA